MDTYQFCMHIHKFYCPLKQVSVSMQGEAFYYVDNYAPKSGWDGVNFLHSSPYGAVFCASD